MPEENNGIPIPNISKAKTELVSKLTSLATVFNKKHGADTLVPASSCKQPDVIPTGIPEIDVKVLVIGGIPRGRVIEIAGETSAGKSTLAINMCKVSVDGGMLVVYSDNEGTMTYEYGESIGLDKESYLIMQAEGLGGPEYLEKILELVENNVDIIVIDSWNGLSSMEAIKAGMISRNMHTDQSIPKLGAAFARCLQAGWVSKLNPGTKDNPHIVKLKDFNTTIIVLNHLMTKVDGSGSKDSSGGEKMKFQYTIRMFLERLSVGTEPQKDEHGDIIYTRIKISTNKNKLAPPFRKAYMFLDNRTGQITSDSVALVDIAKRRNIIEVKTSWIAWTDQFLNRIKDESLKYTDPSLFELLKKLDIDWGAKIQGSKNFILLLEKHPEFMRYVLGT